MLTVVKRDESLQSFKETKIFDAIKKANARTKEKVSDEKLEAVTKSAITFVKGLKRDTVNVEDIHKAVENALMKHNCYDVARQYINHRQERDAKRFKKLPLVGVMESKLFAQDVVNQNANVDEHSFGGRKGEMDSAFLKDYALKYYMSPKFAKNHESNRVYIHDLDSYVLGMHNCLSLPMDELLSSHVYTRQVTIRPAGSASTALQLIAVYMQLQSLQQFGGVAATHVDWTLVPYVRKSFMKHYIVAYLKSTPDFEKLDLISLMFRDYKTPDGVWRNELDDWICKNKAELLEKIGLKEEDFCFDNKKLNKAFRQAATYDTITEVKQGVEGLMHNLNSLQSRSGNQLPFSSINYGTCTLPEGKIVVKAILDTTLKGTGTGQASIFPCQIFQMMDGVNTKAGEPNYDLFKQAIKTVAVRGYPNFVNCDWSQDQGYNRQDPRTYPSTMGCLDGKEHLYVKIDEKVYDISIKDFYEYAKTGVLKNARPADIYFNKARVSVPGDKHVQEKSNINPGSGVYAITYKPLDVTYIGCSSDVCRRWAEHKCHIKLTGGLDAGPSFGDTDPSNYEFKVLEYTPFYEEAEKHWIETEVNINYKGTSQKYYKAVTTKNSRILTDRPNWKLEPAKQDIISLEYRDIQVYDINNNWVKIKHVFKNDKSSSPYMMHIYYDELGKQHCISATEDHPFYTGNGFTKAMDLKLGDSIFRADGEELVITNIGYHWEPVESYDIGTESGTFVGSDIKMHNCRTYSSWDINAPSEELSHLKDGRGNIAPATVILPTLAMEAIKKAKKTEGADVVEIFFQILEKAIEDCKDSLLERFNWICAQPVASADFMYKNKTFFYYGDDLEKEGIRGALKHGTLAIGKLGVAECLQLLIGCDHTDSRGMEVAKRIEQMYQNKCKEYKQQYKLNFGNYNTPAENLCYTAYTKFVKKYGLIENVTAYKDENGKLQPRGYFTNSIHVPVWTKISPYEKIDIESQLTGYSSAGCITYVEIGDNATNNLEALEQLVLYAKSKDIPYFALNTLFSDCTACGYTGYIPETEDCPVCGADHDTYINDFARITGYYAVKVKYFNQGKQKEKRDRYVHTLSLSDWTNK